MKAIIAFALAFQSVQFVCAQETPAAPAKDAAAAAAPSNAGYRDILMKLVQQENELDAAIQKLEAPAKLTARELQTIGLTLNSVSRDLDRISAQNKGEFATVKPGSGVEGYTNAILTYSKKLEKKSALAARLVSGIGKSKRGLRDAVSAKKGKAAGKKLAQVLAEQDAVKSLSADAARLNASARGLHATSRWLNLAAK